MMENNMANMEQFMHAGAMLASREGYNFGKLVRCLTLQLTCNKNANMAKIR